MADVFLLSPEGSEGLIENNESDDGFGAGDIGFPDGNIAGTATPNPLATRVDGFPSGVNYETLESLGRGLHDTILRQRRNAQWPIDNLLCQSWTKPDFINSAFSGMFLLGDPPVAAHPTPVAPVAEPVAEVAPEVAQQVAEAVAAPADPVLTNIEHRLNVAEAKVDSLLGK